MDYVAARQNMVENQIRTNRVTDPAVMQAMAEIPREVFVPKALRGVAYVDEDVDVGGGRAIMEPLTLARLLQAADIKPTDVVLNLGDASGYVTAVLSKLASTVVAVEGEAEWVNKASSILSDLGIDNVAVLQGALELGYPGQAPYDVIVFSGAVSEIPSAVPRQLADGGRLVAVEMSARGVGRGVLMARVGDTTGRRELFDANAPMLPGFAAKPKFVF